MIKPVFGNQITEYAGYTPPQQTDWDTVFEGVEEDIGGVIKARKEERAKNEEVARETENALKDMTTGVNSNFGNYVGRSLQEVKNANLKYYNMLKNNEIDSTQYRLLVNRLSDDWVEFGEFAKNFETRLKDIDTRRQDGKSSFIEYEFFGEKIASASNFGNKLMVVDPTSGGIFNMTYDSDGNPISKSSTSTSSLNNFQRQQVNKQDLTTTIKKYTDIPNSEASKIKRVIAQNRKRIEEVGGLSKWFAETDPRIKQDYENFVKSVEGAIMSQPPNQVASFMGDNLTPGYVKADGTVEFLPGNWFAYDDPADLKKGGKHAGKDRRLGVLMVQQSDGTQAAQLTDDQKKYLEVNTKNIIDTQLGYEEELGLEREKFELEKQKLEVDKFNAQTNRLKAGAKLPEETIDIYDQYVDITKTRNISELNQNENVIDPKFSRDGTILTYKQKSEGGRYINKKLDVTTKQGRRAMMRLIYPTMDPNEIDLNFDKGMQKYTADELKTHVIEQVDFNPVQSRDDLYYEFQDTDDDNNVTTKRFRLKDVVALDPTSQKGVSARQDYINQILLDTEAINENQQKQVGYQHFDVDDDNKRGAFTYKIEGKQFSGLPVIKSGSFQDEIGWFSDMANQGSADKDVMDFVNFVGKINSKSLTKNEPGLNQYVSFEIYGTPDGQKLLARWRSDNKKILEKRGIAPKSEEEMEIFKEQLVKTLNA